jgi:hypothetical protein
MVLFGGETASGNVNESLNPDPAHSETSISFELPGDGPVRLDVYDTHGRRVRTPLDEYSAAGGPGRPVGRSR